ncbi:class I SAM-dependent methyltransferase (plasmid) [Crocosphaera watsonii WH 8501]|uniref:Similar to Methylase involved in ubiquinone/menaquinone biosynthesis n=1 Tax=Crocosphaera watsonii WH 8501 TaxID=165597 RepID=Q4BV43_CROWT|nr:class I SAM-dependent methyltransferase [Crocosphaera watsonii]EAM47774.1 similar to Methylase involved in ubiquinone/menaquinone biosynthesis [Crocosphaera watsonii WH 8501]
MTNVNFVTQLHSNTKRDYLKRVTEYDKAECAAIAKKFGQDYWDGDRRYGYGGYRYDGRWLSVAEAMVKYYGLKPGDKILDVGCGKGYLLYEFTRVIPQIQVCGIDISQYGIEHAKEEIKPFLQVGNATDLPYADQSFDLVISLTTLHNLYNYDLYKALQEIERVGKNHKYVLVESYRNEQERVNLLYWQLTCETFYTPQEWEWFFQQAGYSGDYEYIYFE